MEWGVVAWCACSCAEFRPRTNLSVEVHTCVLASHDCSRISVGVPSLLFLNLYFVR